MPTPRRDITRRIVLKLTAGGLNILLLGNEEELQGTQNLYLEQVNIVGANFPTTTELIIQPIRNGFEFDDVNVSGNMYAKHCSLYVPLAAANQLVTFQPPQLLDLQQRKVPQQMTFHLSNQDGNNPTVTAVYIHLLIK